MRLLSLIKLEQQKHQTHFEIYNGLSVMEDGCTTAEGETFIDWTCLITDADFAKGLLSDAKQLYELAKKNPGVATHIVPNLQKFYK